MLIKFGNREVISLLFLTGAAAWPMISEAAVCPTGQKQILIGGSYTCSKVLTKGVEDDITLRDGGSWPSKFSTFTLAVNPTSPLACGGIEDDDCDDMKHTEHEEKISNSVSSGAAVAPAVVAPAAVTPLPSGVVSCTFPDNFNFNNPHLIEDYIVVPVPGNSIVSLFSGTSTTATGSNPFVIKTNALSPGDTTSPNYILLKGICSSAVAPASEPQDFVPCSHKSKISAQDSTGKQIGKAGTLTCSLPAQQCTGVITDVPLGVDDQGIIGIGGDINESDGSITAMPYNCQ